MAFIEDIYVMVTCDDCGDGWITGRPRRSPRFADYDVARDYVTDNGWTLDGGQLVCPDCTLLAACTKAGHLWNGWQPAGPLTLPGGQLWSGQMRSCQRCPDSEWTPPLTVPALSGAAAVAGIGGVR